MAILCKIASQIGLADARLLFDWSVEGMDLIAQRCQRYGIDCDLTPGHAHAAIKPRQVEELKRWQHDLEENYGYTGTELWGRARLQQELATERYAALLYDPRSSLTAYSANPALVLADWLSNTQYGMGLDVDWASVGAMAAANEAPLGGEPRRRIGLTLSAPQPREAWADTLRNYAGCFVVRRAAGWSLVPDAPVGAVKHFDHASGNIARLGPIKRRSKRDAPTVMHVRWTDTSSLPWRDGIATAYAPGVLDGSLPWRESEVAEPGIHVHNSPAPPAQVPRAHLNDLSDNEPQCRNVPDFT